MYPSPPNGRNPIVRADSALQPEPHCPTLPRVSLQRLFLGLVVGLAACGFDAGSNAVQDAFAKASKAIDPGASVAVRFSSSGGRARLYRLPELDEVTRLFDLGDHQPVRMVGFVSDEDMIYAVARRQNETLDLIALDLFTGRTRTIDTNVVTAAIGPLGTAYLTRPNGTVGEAGHRSAETWPDTLPGAASSIWGAARGRLLALIETDTTRELVALARGQTLARQSLPHGDVTVSRWGRIVAVATESGLVLLDPVDPAAATFVRLSPPPRLVAMSASGHLVYVVLGPNRLAALDRFQHRVSQSLELPGEVAALRVDALGRGLLLRPAEGDSVWIVDPADLSLQATVRGSWQDDLPAIAPDGTVLLRRRNSVVALASTNFGETAQTQEAAGDKWLLIRWDPRRPALELARDTTRAEAQETGRIIYVQISSSRNPAWAQELADELRRAGLNASVLPADSTDEPYRVVLGPYPTREAAEENARRLGRPFFIREIERPIP